MKSCNTRWIVAAGRVTSYPYICGLNPDESWWSWLCSLCFAWFHWFLVGHCIAWWLDWWYGFRSKESVDLIIVGFVLCFVLGFDKELYWGVGSASNRVTFDLCLEEVAVDVEYHKVDWLLRCIRRLWCGVLALAYGCWGHHGVSLPGPISTRVSRSSSFASILEVTFIN